MAEEMKEETTSTPTDEGGVTENDKLWAMLGWLPWVGWILAIVALLTEPQKGRPFVRYHAVQALAANVVLTVLGIVLGITVILSCIAPFLWLALIYPAVKSYQGDWLELPVLTEFCQNQGWI